jgi:hypothetical protein
MREDAMPVTLLDEHHTAKEAFIAVAEVHHPAAAVTVEAVHDQRVANSRHLTPHNLLTPIQ